MPGDVANPSVPAPARLVVRLPNWIGDIVMATPALRALRTHWPDAHIAVAGPAHAQPLLNGLESIDEVIALPSRKEGGVGALRTGAALLREGAFEMALLLTHSFSTSLVARWAGIPRRAGYGGGWRSSLLTDVVPCGRERGRHRMPIPMVESYFRLLEALGIPRGSHRFELAVTDEEEGKARDWLERHGIEEGESVFGIHAGSSFGPSKLWIPERFAEVADRLYERHGSRSVLFCGPLEQDLVREIASHAKSPILQAADDPIDLATLKAVIRRLKLLISTDTGPRHLGPAFDIPTVVLMGSTDPRFTNTNLHDSLVVRTEVDCSPCQLKVCPIDHRCMERLTPDMVLAATERLLQR